MRLKKKHIFLSSLVILPLLFFSFTSKKLGNHYFEIAKNMKIFAQLYQEVNTYYVDDVNPSELMTTGIEAMLATLDPYTNYIPEDRIEDYRTMTTGEYGGLGVVVGNRNGDITVILPNEGYPAYEAGLQIGDIIKKVDGDDISGKNTEEISKYLKGQAGSEVTLTIKRFGQEQPFDVKVKREKIQINNVPYYGMVTDNVGLIQLSDFTRNASKEVGDALTELKDRGATKIIIDLRGNPGGLLNEAVSIVNLFVPKGSDVVYTKGRIEDWNKTYKAMNPPLDTEIPIAVLVNGGSASAAEIVSGSIQDYDRGVLLGSRSFGKGLVQATRPLDYNSRLKVTVAKYYIPSGRCIQAIDYSHRNEDGEAIVVADSLREQFKTANGRPVLDGGGVMPDIKVKPFNFAQITVSLILKGLIFDYATKFHHENEKIVAARDFNLSDAQFEDFVEWLKDKDYGYQTKVEVTMEELEKSAKEDKYYEDIKDEIENLRKLVYHNKESDVIKFRQEITDVLEAEICKRYYLEAGEIESTFTADLDVIEAVKVLNDDARYQKILSGN
ncbi:S41 family peptidase [Flammeovirga yaeyamensis]|uniref:S41 family peptidase n=1 Tax=Flammeovirga yaeyamensis TaxID=367791 RepID=A0AAX1N2P8_9BACT|nr:MULTISPECIES: S41 family peptidase [Flammeovirga]ANQ50814.1 S41 family peptidase [Flammeovirga sp. MY04]MBB3700801.1 carboxyl-terminal processing protease [Flammeovirga yaeyamensis]NMF37844.1 S41 family peptidase [Flammeovirga yaeyamensis]QWG01794.1 S41 family peptidase [Flammeovirga yaeyamensis]